jgi:DNA-binding NtrC family response regulator
MTKRVDTTTQNDSDGGDPRDDRVSPLELHVVHSPDLELRGTVVPASAETDLVLGRAAPRGLAIADNRVSRSHVRIVWDARAQRYRCADLASANGTFLNGQRIQSALLGNNDVLRLGDTLLVATMPKKAALRLERERRAARSALPIMILGETGSGKERLARDVHEHSGRSGAFVALNCATLSRELAASELFGHTRGAFSGAGNARAGLFRSADRGTLFLDEVGDLPQDVQPALLRALQEGVIRPLGTDQELAVDVRIVCATHMDIERRIGSGLFREDLYARLAHIVLRVLPLRERREEILSLASQFAPSLRRTTAAAELLLLWGWPRNIRELRALMESLAVIEASGTVLTPEHLSHISAAALPTRPSTSSVENEPANQRKLLTRLLTEHQGNVAAVARELGKPRSQIYRWLRVYDLSVARSVR